MMRVGRVCAAVVLAGVLLGAGPATRPIPSGTKVDGYRGIWFELGQKSEFGDKYSGGLGTYTANHVPIAVYAPKVEKTFFVYGGTSAPGERHLLIMASWFDHKRVVVPRPVVVHDKVGVNDPHDNAALSMDGEGYLWVFVSGRARGRKGFIYRSGEPYSIERWELVKELEITYPQPKWIEGRGFFHLFTKYTKGRELYFATSKDGREWSEDKKLAGFGGHYQVSAEKGGVIGTAFMWHPGGNVDKRTNLYYVQTRDFGETWETVSGEKVELSLAEVGNAGLLIDYQKQGLNVYIHDLAFDREGRPVILYLTAAGHLPGPPSEPRVWRVTKWDGKGWKTYEVCRSDHAYDTGCLMIGEEDWRVVGPSGEGPQKWGTGGEVETWVSSDRGETWKKEREVTKKSVRNHSYVRRVMGGRPDFEVMWADGDANAFSESHLYFGEAGGGKAWELPYLMRGEEGRARLTRPE